MPLDLVPVAACLLHTQAAMAAFWWRYYLNFSTTFCNIDNVDGTILTQQQRAVLFSKAASMFVV